MPTFLPGEARRFFYARFSLDLLVSAGANGPVSHKMIVGQKKEKLVMDAAEVARALTRIAHEILERNKGMEGLALVGIRTGGVYLAHRLAKRMAEFERGHLPIGELDITLYRDDLQTVGPRPVVGPTSIPVDIDGQHVVIVDDVLYTGRTVRAALDELADFGRPRRIALAVVVDRGGRELPIAPDVVGKKVDIGVDQRVDVHVKEMDGRDAVIVAPRDA